MLILNLHGLNGSCHNTNFKTISKIYEGDSDVVIVSPQIDYTSDSPYEIIGHILSNIDKPDIIIGNSFGGFFAYVLGAITNAKTLLVNPCIPPHEYLGKLVIGYPYLDELKEIWNKCSGLNHDYHVLVGDSDDVLNTHSTLNVLKPQPERITIIAGGHSLSGEDYEIWLKENLK